MFFMVIFYFINLYKLITINGNKKNQYLRMSIFTETF